MSYNYEYDFSQISKNKTALTIYLYFNVKHLNVELTKERRRILIASRTQDLYTSLERAQNFVYKKSFLTKILQICHNTLKCVPKDDIMQLQSKFATGKYNPAITTKCERSIIRITGRIIRFVGYKLTQAHITNEMFANYFTEYEKQANEIISKFPFN